MAQLLGAAYKQIAATSPRGTYRGAVVGCGRMGSTIDDEHIGMAHRGAGLYTLSQAQIHHIMDRLNHRPRKGLAFQTPHEILCKETEVQPKHGEIALTS